MIKTNRQYLFLLVPVMLLSWILFKWAYPFADFFVDSYSYIQAAADHDSISYRPIGYSFFLRLVHALSASDSVLVTVQYGLVQLACLRLFFFLRRHCQLAAWAQGLLAAFLVLDPLIYYTCNYVSSDALFIALSLFWLTVLLQLLRRPSWSGLILQLLLLVFIFYTRYVALFYPVVAALIFLLVRRNLFFKVTGIVASIAVVAAATFYTRRLTREQTGAPVFSAFSGWQMANNALNMYPSIPPDTSGLPSPACRALAQYVNDYFEHGGTARSVATTAYMWEKSSPLHQYLNAYEKSNPSISYFIAWNRVAPLYSTYGYFLLRRHPVAFGRYYLWPSAKGFFVPPLDIFAVYNEGKKEVDPVAQQWFHYASPRPKVASATIQATIFAPFPWFFLLLNLGFATIGLLFFCSSRLRRRDPAFIPCLQLAAVYLLTNACFNIFASPSVLRYQVLPLILLFTFVVAGASVWSNHLFALSYCSINDKPPSHE
jgi:hypothetical protein